MQAVESILCDFVGVHYPANYGFVPRSYSPDSDPLDVLMLSQDAVAWPWAAARRRSCRGAAAAAAELGRSAAEDERSNGHPAGDPDRPRNSPGRLVAIRPGDAHV